MPLAFLPGAALALSRGRTSPQLSTTSFHGRRVCAAVRSRRALLRHTACVAVKKDADAVDDEEKLDEAAMRAAEIHEVLSGLKEFKGRIIDDATKLAKKVRAPKKQLEAALATHPDIVKIDGHIKELEEELKVIGDR